jgi:hypothetical protein
VSISGIYRSQALRLFPFGFPHVEGATEHAFGTGGGEGVEQVMFQADDFVRGELVEADEFGDVAVEGFAKFAGGFAFGSLLVFGAVFVGDSVHGVNIPKVFCLSSLRFVVATTLATLLADLVNLPGQPRKSNGQKDRDSHTEEAAVNTSNHVVSISDFL